MNNTKILAIFEDMVVYTIMEHYKVKRSFTYDNIRDVLLAFMLSDSVLQQGGVLDELNVLRFLESEGFISYNRYRNDVEYLIQDDFKATVLEYYNKGYTWELLIDKLEIESIFDESYELLDKVMEFKYKEVIPVDTFLCSILNPYDIYDCSIKDIDITEYIVRPMDISNEFQSKGEKLAYIHKISKARQCLFKLK